AMISWCIGLHLPEARVFGDRARRIERPETGLEDLHRHQPQRGATRLGLPPDCGGPLVKGSIVAREVPWCSDRRDACHRVPERGEAGGGADRQRPTQAIADEDGWLVQ